MRYESKQYDPEVNSGGPIAEGEYFFAVQDAVAATSSNGNDMIELTLEVDVGRDRPVAVFDRLVATQTALWKIHTFCESCGLDFHADELLPEHCLGREGRAQFVLGEPNRAGRQYLEVYRYLLGDEPASSATPTNTGAQKKLQRPTGNDDDLPF